MDKYLGILFVAFIGAVFAKNENAGLSLLEEPSECGGVVLDNSREITYKQFEIVGDNERCVWIVAAPNATSYNVRVTSEDGFLNVGVLSRRTLMDYSYKFNSTWTTVRGNILVITFQSQTNANSKGFALEYEGASTNSYYTPFTYHSFINARTLYFKHPSGKDLYDNDDLSVFVYPVGDNIYKEGVTRYLVYKLLGMEDLYNDFAEIYAFNSTGNQFNSIGRMYYTMNTKLFSSDDLMLVTFHSDSSRVGEGFSLSAVVTNCSCSQ